MSFWTFISNVIASIVANFVCAVLRLVIKIFPQLEKYKETTEYLNKRRIDGVWYSAELDLKQNSTDNAILQIRIERRWTNYVRISTVDQVNDISDSQPKTAWIAYGKVVTENTLTLNWEGKIENSTRYGNAFLQFIDNNRAIGYWIGYASKKSMHPVYGYWILSREKKDLCELAEKALKKFIFVDIKELIENHGKLEEMNETIQNIVSNNFSCEEKDITDFRKKYHGYWVSKSNGVTHWSHAVFDFSKKTRTGKLIANISFKSPTSADTLEYYCEAVMIDDKLIFVITAKEGKEPASVGAMLFGHHHEKTSCGILIHESYSHEQMTNPFILSLSPIGNWTEEGKINDVNVSSFLWRIWRNDPKLNV